MDSAAVICQAVTTNSWETSVGWSDAYHHVPVYDIFKNFLVFHVGAQDFRYVCCSFGLSLLPQVFTEVCLRFKAHMPHTFAVPVFQYLDDWLFFFPDRAT